MATMTLRPALSPIHVHVVQHDTAVFEPPLLTIPQLLVLELKLLRGAPLAVCQHCSCLCHNPLSQPNPGQRKWLAHQIEDGSHVDPAFDHDLIRKPTLHPVPSRQLCSHLEGFRNLHQCCGPIQLLVKKYLASQVG
jgi:hypothetical protein